jgi:signal transduction histidine kinase
MSTPASIQTYSSQERFKQFARVTPALINQVSPQEVLRLAVRLAAEVIGARYAAIEISGPGGRSSESITSDSIHAEHDASPSPPIMDSQILNQLLGESQPIRLPDFQRYPGHGFPAAQSSAYSLLAVPIVGRQGVFGHLYLYDKTGGDVFTEEDEDIAVLLAAKTSAALENARHHEESARLLEEVQQLHRARERFFAMVNHELRNALAAVHGWAELLIRKKDPPTVPRAAFEVLDSAQHAVALINDLLDLSRLDENRLNPDIRSVEPVSMARRAMGRVTPAANDKRIDLQLAARLALPNCETDSSRVEQILVNLLGNAIKYAPEQSSVTISITADGRFVVFQVEDEGPGVPASEVERIFNIYVTKPGGDTRGLGLGLPLSQRLARMLGGELRAVAVPGKGGYFILEVPASAT